MKIKDVIKQLVSNPPLKKNGERITIGRINTAFWKGYDGIRMSISADKGSMAEDAWKAGKKYKDKLE